jgi:hypothetical protein
MEAYFGRAVWEVDNGEQYPTMPPPEEWERTYREQIESPARLN